MATIPGQSSRYDDHAARRESDTASPVAEAEAEAEAIRSVQEPHGEPGRRWDRRSPFFIGLAAAAGVAVVVALAQLIMFSLNTLVLIGMALFIAVGLDPAVSWGVRRGLSRRAAVTIVTAGFLASVAGFLLVVIPPLANQAAQIITRAPELLRRLSEHSALAAGLSQRFALEQRLQSLLSGGNGDAMLEAGKAALGTLADLLVILVLSIYFVADLPRIREALYRFVPHSRRPRAILLGDEMFSKVGFYVLGNVLISLIAGSAAFVWLVVFDVPYALMLSLLVAVLDLIPVVGSTAAGLIAILTALTVSVPVCLATVGFFLAYRVIEDYVLLPKIIGRVLRVPSLITLVAILLGGVLLGVIGALVAIPIAASALLILREVTFRRLDEA
jgi:predicted PurR-regulated permease PerM